MGQHDCSASSTSVPHTHGFYRHYLKKADGQVCASMNNECDTEYYEDTSHQTSDEASASVSTSCSTSSHSSGIGGVDSAARSGTETRPINMKVSYVMRCW